MSYSELQLYNLAVDAVGGTGTIETTTEASREAELCSRWFGPVRDKVLRAAHWQSAKKVARLAQFSPRVADIWEPSDPSPGYHYGYSLPSDIIIPRHLADFARFELSIYENGQHMLSTSGSSSLLYYTARFDVEQMESSLALAIAAALAAHICEPLTGATRKAQFKLQEANEAIMQARLETANIDHQPISHIPDFIAVRGYGTPFQGQNFIYPFGPSFVAGDIGG